MSCAVRKPKCASAAGNSQPAPSHSHDMQACAFQADSACKASQMSETFVKHATPSGFHERAHFRAIVFKYGSGYPAFFKSWNT